MKTPAIRFPEFTDKWIIKKGSELFNSRREKGNENLPIFSVTMDRGLVPRDTLEKKMKNDAKLEENLIAMPNDIVYNMMRMWQGAMGVVNRKCIC